MVHWPKTVSGNLVALVLGVCVVLIVVQSAIALSGPFIWASLVAVTVTVATLFIWRRRSTAARDLAVIDAPSFADVLRTRNEADSVER